MTEGATFGKLKRTFEMRFQCAQREQTNWPDSIGQNAGGREKSDHFLPARKRQEREHSDQKICVQGHIRDFMAVQLEQNAGQMLVQRHAVQKARVRASINEGCPKRQKTRTKKQNRPDGCKTNKKSNP